MGCGISSVNSSVSSNGCKACKPVATLNSGCAYSVKESYNEYFDREQPKSYGSTASIDTSCNGHRRRIGCPEGHFTSSTYGEIQESERQSHDDYVDNWYIAAFQCSEVRPFFAPKQAEAERLITDLRELQRDLQSRAGGHTSIESSVAFCRSIDVSYGGRFHAATRVCARCQPERQGSPDTSCFTQFREVSRALNIIDRLACSPYTVVKSYRYPFGEVIPCEVDARATATPKAAGMAATPRLSDGGPGATVADQRKDGSSSSVVNSGQVELGCAASDPRSLTAQACAQQLSQQRPPALSRKARMRVSSRRLTSETKPAQSTSSRCNRQGPRLVPSEIVLKWTMMPTSADASAGAGALPHGPALLSTSEAAKSPETGMEARIETESMTGSSTEASEDSGGRSGGHGVDGDTRYRARGTRPGAEVKAMQSSAEPREFIIRPLFLLRTQGPMWRFLLRHAQFVRTLGRKVGVPQLAVVRLAEVGTAGSE